MEWGEFIAGLRCGNSLLKLTSEWESVGEPRWCGNSSTRWKGPLQTVPLSVVPLPRAWEGALLLLYREGVFWQGGAVQVVYDLGAT